MNLCTISIVDPENGTGENLKKPFSQKNLRGNSDVVKGGLITADLRPLMQRKEGDAWTTAQRVTGIAG
jgi:hypothetical protein